jgi:hypothetical protein
MQSSCRTEKRRMKKIRKKIIKKAQYCTKHRECAAVLLDVKDIDVREKNRKGKKNRNIKWISVIVQHVENA